MPATTDRKLRVFLCHSSQDKPIVRELYKRLMAEGWIDPWLDEEKLLPGQDWNMEIEKAVETADAVVVCLSNNSVTKEGYIQRELRFVLDIADYKPDGTVFVIPVRLDECPSPRRLRMWQYVDYFPVTHKDLAYSRLVKSLQIRAGINSVSNTEVPSSFSEDKNIDIKRQNVFSLRDKVFRELKEGQVVQGKVSRLTNVGAFVDIGGVEALVHITEISNEPFYHVAEVLEVGQTIDVKIKKLEPKNKRIILSIRAIELDAQQAKKAIEDEDWRKLFSKYAVGQLVEGVITRLTKFGAFARLEGDIEGLIHVSEISQNRIEHPKEILNVGDVKILRVIRIDSEQRRVGLSLRKVDSAIFVDPDFSLE